MTGQWLGALPAVVVAMAILLAPGLIATAPLRVGPVPRVALSAALSVACIGIAGAAFGLVGIGFSPWQIVVPAVVVGAVLLLVRGRLPRPAARAGADRGAWWLVPAWVAASVIVAVVAFWHVPSPELFSQTYDNVFHLSATAHILTDGDASSLTLRTLIEPDRTWSFYPAAWHTLVASTSMLSGASIAVASNAAWIAVCAAVWLPGAAWLAQLVVRGFPRTRVALVALPIGASFGSMPYALLSWGTIYPTLLATALLPAAVGVPVVLWTRRREVARVVGVLGGGAALALVLGAVCVAQPRVLATWVVLIAPFVVVSAARVFLRAWRAGGMRRRRAVITLSAVAAAGVLAAAAAFAYVVLRLGLFDRPLDDRLGGPQARATQSVLAGILEAFGQAWPTGSSGTVAFSAILLAVFVVVGAVAVWRAGRFRWAVVSAALLVLLFALAAGSDDVVTKLMTALWYKDRYRLSSAIPVLGVAFATAGILATAAWLRGRSTLRERAEGVLVQVLAWLTALTAAATLVVSGAAASIGEVFEMPDSAAGDEVVSRQQIDFLRQVGEIVPDDQLLLGDPWDGSALSLMFGGARPVFPHVNGQWDAHRIALAHRFAALESDPSVCEALDALRVRYVVYNPHEFGGGDPIGNQFFAIHDAVEAGLLEPVLTDGESTLYRVESCGPLPDAGAGG
ncbi:DUF6541 family protein [Microbacterium sp. BWT-B31]|uniref:DUF6541 family protein n=1 Tax=Microbacterium sp. BWT-B31 TaxID=3232072 RepID=UPI003527C65F